MQSHSHQCAGYRQLDVEEMALADGSALSGKLSGAARLRQQYKDICVCLCRAYVVI